MRVLPLFALEGGRHSAFAYWSTEVRSRHLLSILRSYQTAAASSAVADASFDAAAAAANDAAANNAAAAAASAAAASAAAASDVG
jgi:hypothetical protein